MPACHLALHLMGPSTGLPPGSRPLPDTYEQSTGLLLVQRTSAGKYYHYKI